MNNQGLFMKTLFIFTLISILLLSCTDNSKNSLTISKEDELISTLMNKANKETIIYDYLINFGEVVDSVYTIRRNYYINDTLIILGADINNKGIFFSIFERDSSQHLLKVISYNPLTKKKRNTVYLYDANFNNTSVTTYDENNKIGYKAINKFDSKNNLIEKFNYDSTGNVWLKTNYEYDNKGLKIKEVKENNDQMPAKDEIYFTYDVKNRLKSELNKTYFDRGGLHWQFFSDDFTVYKYNDNNNLIEIIKKSPYSKLRNISYIDSREKYTYDNDGNLVEYITYITNKSEKESISFQRVYFYNEKNDKIEYKVYNRIGELTAYKRYEHNYFNKN
jgi:hypothetical protein